ncbi:hypothetical protein PybrP1_009194 [[Pythium] brassicae (nom. inval.)]|nr:hypothetical protein PybrP1_009194 [[Pythium] brassicae (nom. inval.)]
MDSSRGGQENAPAPPVAAPPLSPLVQLLPTGYRDIQPFQKGRGWHTNGPVGKARRLRDTGADSVVFPVISSRDVQRRDADERQEREDADRTTDLHSPVASSSSPSMAAIPVPPSAPRRPSRQDNNHKSSTTLTASLSFRTRAIAAAAASSAGSTHEGPAGSSLSANELPPANGAVADGDPDAAAPDPEVMAQLWQEYEARTKPRAVVTETYHRKMQHKYTELKAMRERIHRLESELADALRERDEAREVAARSVQESVVAKWKDSESSDELGLQQQQLQSSTASHAALSARKSVPKAAQHLTPEDVSYREKAFKLERALAATKDSMAETRAQLTQQHAQDREIISALTAKLLLEQEASQLLSKQLHEATAAFQSAADVLVSTQIELERAQIHKQIVLEQVQQQTNQLLSDHRRTELQNRVRNVIRSLGREALHQKMEALHTRALVAEQSMRKAQLQVANLKVECTAQQLQLEQILSSSALKYHSLAADGGVPGILERATPLFYGARVVTSQLLMVQILFEDERTPRAMGTRDEPTSGVDEFGNEAFRLHFVCYEAQTAQDDFLTFQMRDIRRLVPDYEKYMACYSDRKRERLLEMAEILFAHIHAGYKNGHLVVTEVPATALESNVGVLTEILVNEVYEASTSDLWWLEIRALVLDSDGIALAHCDPDVLDHRCIVRVAESFYCVQIQEIWDAELMLEIAMEKPETQNKQDEAASYNLVDIWTGFEGFDGLVLEICPIFSTSRIEIDGSRRFITLQSLEAALDYDIVYTDSERWVLSGAAGHGVCEGYAYNFPGRDVTSIGMDFAHKLLPVDKPDAPVCQYHPRDANYTSWRTAVTAKPGDTLFFAYFSNGHVMKDKAGLGTKQGVYWSGTASEALERPSQLTPERLVSGLQNFDDGNCGETYVNGNFAGGTITSGRAGDFKPCVGSFVVPPGIKTGTYPMVWYWSLAKQGEESASNEAYSSCFDVIVHTDADEEKATVQSEADSTEISKMVMGKPIAFVASPAPTGSKCDVATDTVPAPTSKTPEPQTSSSPSGSYGKVTDMQCPGDVASSGTCVQTATAVDGPIAPFDEDLTLALRGPLEIDDIAVFTKSNAGPQWSKVSSYSRKQGNAAQNMVFLNNKGDASKSGEFSICHGNSQSFATANGTAAASSLAAFGGVLADGVEVNVMSATATPSPANGTFARGAAFAGWSGNHKIFMVKAQMPHAHAGGEDLPSIWLLNGQVVRTAQYACNCRGVGDRGKWKGGCGELDVAEIIPENKAMLTSTIYSFKGSRGTSPVMPRPTSARVVFVVILSAATGDRLGTAQILMMHPEDVDVESAPSAQRVDEWLACRAGVVVNFDI